MEPGKYKISPDGASVAIRTIWPEDGTMAYSVASESNANSWATARQVEGWRNVTEIEPLPEEVQE